MTIFFIIFTHTVVEVTEVFVLVMGNRGAWDVGTQGCSLKRRNVMLLIHPEGWGRCVF